MPIRRSEKVANVFDIAASRFAGKSNTKNTITLVLKGGAALYLYGMRENLGELDLYVDDELLPASVLQNISDDQVEFLSSSVLPQEIKIPFLNSMSDLVYFTDVKGQRFEMKIAPLEVILIDKMLCQRDKDIPDINELLKVVDTSIVCDILSKAKGSNDPYKIEDVCETFISDYSLNLLISGESSTSNNQKLVDIINRINLDDDWKSRALRNVYSDCSLEGFDESSTYDEHQIR
jgi:hypothetical protein